MELYAEPCSPLQVDHAEGPFWADDRLGWVDIAAGNLHLATFDGKTLSQATTYNAGRQLGAVAPREGGGWILAAGAGFLRLDPDGALTDLTGDLADPAVIRMNDGKCDPAGRFWAGTMGFREEPGIACLYRFDGTAPVTLTGVTISNGLGWSPDHRTMYYIDTPTGRVDAFDYDEAAGTIEGRRHIITVDAGHPDGMTVDDEGLLWVALWGAGQVRRYDTGGRHVATVHVPATYTSSCCFGGPDGRTLFISTSRRDLTAAEREQEPDAGRIFRVEPGVTGPPVFPYRER